MDGYLPGIQLVADKNEAEVALVGGKAIDLNEFPRLRGIFKTGVGRDNVPEVEARRRGIHCGFPSPATAAIIYEETASFACHLILRCLYVEIGDFRSWAKLDRPSLSSREVLVVGTGQIGGRVAKKMHAFAKVSTFDIATHPPTALKALVSRADCVTLHIPLTDDTRGFFDATKLAWLKDGAALVNTARGAIVDEEALHRELAAGRLRAAFDVFWQEPYQGCLLGLPSEQFIVSPHVASTCREFIAATAGDFRNFLKSLEAS
ncbi:MAG TPA: NAD(P)-dependent oxidoreductase [Kiritimatiellia bacterium]|nr:NAD(P)-dependent oxidoreductase [Kiritimatiellia bacterium]